MKRNLLVAAVAMLSLVLASSCQKHEGTYSCDPEVNRWAHQNINEIQKMSRSEFVKLKENVQIAAFKAMTPSQRADMWKIKLEETLYLKWTDEEKPIFG